MLFRDLLCGNGMIHVIDKIMWHVGDYQETSSVSKVLPSNATAWLMQLIGYVFVDLTLFLQRVPKIKIQVNYQVFFW